MLIYTLSYMNAPNTVFTNLKITLYTFIHFSFAASWSHLGSEAKTTCSPLLSRGPQPALPCSSNALEYVEGGPLEDAPCGRQQWPSLLCLEAVHGVVLGEAVALLVYAQHRLALPALVHGAPLQLHHAAHDAAPLGARLGVVVRTPGPPVTAACRVLSAV